MRRILVAVDESPALGRAATFVNAFFKADDVSVVAVNVARVPVGIDRLRLDLRSSPSLPGLG